MVKTKRDLFVESLANKDSEAKPVAADPKISDISIDDLIGKHLLMIYRDTGALLAEGLGKKLSKESSQCLRDNLKLLLELKDREKEILAALTYEDLQKIAKDET